MPSQVAVLWPLVLWVGRGNIGTNIGTNKEAFAKLVFSRKHGSKLKIVILISSAGLIDKDGPF